LASTEPERRHPESVELVASLIAEAGLHALLIGGHAVNFWLEPRFTAHIDLTVLAEPEAIRRAEAFLVGAGFTKVTEHGAGLSSGPDFVRFRRDREPSARSIVLELQTAKTSFQEAAVRRGAIIGPDQRLPVATPEDLIIMKLIASRRKDLGDLLGLFTLHGLDWQYIERWAEAWEVTDRLAEMRRLIESEHPGV
jgi:hypothetical protein